MWDGVASDRRQIEVYLSDNALWGRLVWGRPQSPTIYGALIGYETHARHPPHIRNLSISMTSWPMRTRRTPHNGDRWLHEWNNWDGSILFDPACLYTNYIILHVFLYNISPPRFGLSKCSVSCSLPPSFSFHTVYLLDLTSLIVSLVYHDCSCSYFFCPAWSSI